MRWWFAILFGILPGFARAAEPTSAQIEFFEKKIRPILAENCYSCHGEKKQSGGLRLDSAAGLRTGADGTPIVVAGEPAKSKLIAAVKRTGDYPMPPKKALPQEAVATLTEWVESGAPIPADRPSGATTSASRHWAFQAVREPVVPAIADPKQPLRNAIDHFLTAKLGGRRLSLALPADRRTLIRRAYFDLIGLPPTPTEVEAFEKSADPLAWEKLIDQLLASPRYGERWARHWLDLARYADTKGYIFNQDRNYPYAYTYRDYVIRSFNEDMPYDRFIIEQLAADRLPLGSDKRPLAALGFLTLGRRFLGNQQDIIDDRIDVVTRGLMGLTVACARCHDHKYDPIPSADYYSLYGVFASTTEPTDLPLIGEVKRTPEVMDFEKELARREAEYTAEVKRRYEAKLKKLREPKVVAEYLQAVLDSRDMGDQQQRGFARERGLNSFALGRWRAYIHQQFQASSPVYAPLAVLAGIPGKEFATKAAGVIASLGKDPRKPVNPLILKALQDTRPKTLKAAVEAVARVIADSAPTGPLTKEQADVFAVWGAGGPIDIPFADAEKLGDRADREALAAMKRKIDAFKAASPFAPPRAHVLNDLPTPFQPYVFIRGNQANHGPAVPRQAPAVVASNRKPFSDGSGRLELAKAIASPENPLTARVMVNRIWASHFGHGLVRTPSDFGTRSEPPTHPELLDWLAAQFVKNGWSIKKLHKIIMLSATYCQASTIPAEVQRLDPDNRLLSHQNRRRLDFEALRDSFLSVAGKLDPTMGGKPVDLFKTPFSTRRSVYGLIDRTSFPGTMRTFDVASPDQHAPRRFETTVPQQALFLMNSPFLTEQAKSLYLRLEVANSTTPAAKVTALYRLALSRKPTSEEVSLAIEFTRDDDPKATFGKWPQLAQVLLLSNEFAFVD